MTEKDKAPKAMLDAHHEGIYFAAVRQLTGTPQYRHAYVYQDNKVISACSHRHRTDRSAKACADKMLRGVLRSKQ